MKAVIVEDDFIVADHLRMMLNKYGIKVLDVVDNFEDATSSRYEDAKLFFLDIRIDGAKSGIDIGNELHIKGVDFIYVTANNEMNTLKKAVKTEPLAYITKPYKESDIVAIIELIKNKSGATITVKSNYGKKIIPLRSVLYFKSDGPYIEVVTKKESFIERNSLSQLQELYQSNFIRIHRSYLVNKAEVEEHNSKHVFINNEPFPLSRNYKKDFMKHFNS